MLSTSTFLQVLQDPRWRDPSQLRDLLLSLPSMYRDWWLELYRDAPMHVFVETALVLFVLWLVFIRRTIDPSKISDSSKKFNEKEVKWLVDTWEPEPLVPAVQDDRSKRIVAASKNIVTSAKGNYLEIQGVEVPVLNLASFDFLSLSQNSRSKAVSRETLMKYGVGSCGPRGFYGTIDLHLQFEKAIAEHMGVEEAISYSDGASAVSSTITAFAKRGDLLLVDEACGEAIRTGANLSRASVHYFKHNDMEDLANILSSIIADDVRLKRDASNQRRFIVAEGLYRSTGNICPLPDIMRLKEKHFFRLILDESLSFGCLGKTGRGVTEVFTVPASEVDVLVISMGSSLASVGGVSMGTREVVDHQRLSGPGYCFSASAPPFFSAAALNALDILRDDVERTQILSSLDRNVRAFYELLESIPGLKIVTNRPSKDVAAPIIHVCLDEQLSSVAAMRSRCTEKTWWEAQEAVLNTLVNECVSFGAGITVSIAQAEWIEEYVRTGSSLQPSIRICVTAQMTAKDIKQAAKVLKNAFSQMFEGKSSRR